MNELLVRQPVETILVSVRCPSKTCEGTLKSDGKSRTRDGLHGGPLEYRHACTVCQAGAWLLKAYPQVEYQPVKKEILHAASDSPIVRKSSMPIAEVPDGSAG